MRERVEGADDGQLGQAVERTRFYFCTRAENLTDPDIHRVSYQGWWQTEAGRDNAVTKHRAPSSTPQQLDSPKTPSLEHTSASSREAVKAMKRGTAFLVY